MNKERQGQAAILVLVLGLLLAGGALWARNPWREQRVALQPRANMASARCDQGRSIAQTFRAPMAQLSAIELLIVWPPSAFLASTTPVTLTLERVDATHAPIVVGRKLLSPTHNAPLRFDFEPLPDSRNAEYLLTFSGSPSLPLAVWATTEESYADGAYLEDGAPQPGDLYLVLYARYTLRQAVQDALRLAQTGAPTTLAIALLLWLPGLALGLWLLPRPVVDPFQLLAVTLGFGLALWPLFYLWGTTLGLAIRAGGVWGLLCLSAFAIAWRWASLRRRGIAWHLASPGRGPALVVMTTLLLGLALRWTQARALLVPNWVDGYHHSVLAQIMTDTGRLPITGEPYVQMSLFHYHFGFHAVAATLAQWTALEPYLAVLWLGHALNALAALATYGLTREIVDRPWAGAIAAAMVSCISYMPAYYVSWGRYTQLMGLVMLAPLWALTERLLATSETDHPKQALRRLSWRDAAAVALLAAGLALTHYRVLAFYVLYVVVRIVVALVANWRMKCAQRMRLIAPLAVTAVMALSLIAPWAWRFRPVAREVIPDVYGGWSLPDVAQDPFPIALVRYGWTPYILAIAGIGALWALVRRRAALITVALWCGALLCLANPQWVNLPRSWLISNVPVGISYWLPAGVLGGWLLAEALHGAARLGARWMPRLAWRSWLSAVAVLAVLGMAGWGSWRMIDIINPTTVLVTDEEIEAMRWARTHIAPGGRFLLNTRPWMNEVRMGVDGGWWLPLIGGHDTTLPCILYTQGSASYRQAILDLASLVESDPALDDPDTLEALSRAGVTHVFLGSRPGPMSAAVLDRNPNLERLYTHGPVRIYAFRPQRP